LIRFLISFTTSENETVDPERLVTMPNVLHHSKNRVFSCLSVSIGLVADLDRMAEENFRFLPPSIRVFLGQAKSFLRRKTYRCKLTFTPLRFFTEKNGKRTLMEDEPIEINTSFLSILACNIPWIASDAYMAPKIKIDDGLISLQVIRGRPGLYSLLKEFLKLETGGHLKSPLIEEYLVHSFQLDPLDSGACIVMDGISIGTHPISVNIRPSLLTLTK